MWAVWIWQTCARLYTVRPQQTSLRLRHKQTRKASTSGFAKGPVPRMAQKRVDVTSPLQCAGINRHEAENERVSRERSSDPLGLESCVATVRDPTKRGQRIGGVGIQLRKDAIRTPTSL